jgi:hypothetical protein
LLFAWHGENTTVTSGDPAGCSVGDASATVVSGATLSTTQYKDGAYSISIPTADDGYTFDWDSSTSPIVTVNSGKVDLWVYWTTITYGTSLFSLTVDASNHINIYNETDSLFMYHVAGGTIRQVATSAGSITTGTWYHVIGRWYSTGSDNYYLQLCVDTTTGTTCTNGSWYDALGTWSGTAGTVTFGDIGTNGGVYFIDNIRISDSGAF